MVSDVGDSDDESDVDESDDESDSSVVETFSRSKEVSKGPPKSAGTSSSINKPSSNTTQKSSQLQETKNGKAQNNLSRSNQNAVLPPTNEDASPNDGSTITSEYSFFAS